MVSVLVVVAVTVQLSEYNGVLTWAAAVRCAEVAMVVNSESLEICFHVGQAQTFPAHPAVNVCSDLAEALCVAAVDARLAPAHDEEEAVNHLMQEGRDEQASVILRIS